MSDIVYPPGCRPLTEDVGSDELIRRLKNVTHKLQGMGQDDGNYQQFIPLALHLVDDYFLQHTSKDVQLLIGCCVADVLRIYAPEAPYKDQSKIKEIFMFLIKQLNGLKDPKDPGFKRYFYLLENLAYVKSFNMCFELEDSQEIFCNLFGLIFRIVNDEHSVKVKTFMLDVLSPLITESDNVSFELLDVILINILEPYKSQRKNAYQLARDLIIKTSDTLETYIKAFFNQVLILDKVDRNYAISTKVYDLIYELNVISPKILSLVLPQLECKIKSSNELERLRAVSLLARMFSEKNSNLSKKHIPLWRQFLGRFCDIGTAIRIKCVQSTMHFLINQSHIRKEIIDALKLRQHDSDETVRYEVVMSIVETAKRDFHIVAESKDLLEIVKERTLDKKFKIRKEAMCGLAFVYKKLLLEKHISEDTKTAVNWIKNKILHGYYMTGIEDRLLVERLLITSLVPYQFSSEERMKNLYKLLGTIDDNATKAFIELQKNQMKIRKTVSDWVKLHRLKDASEKIKKEMNLKCAVISKLLPDPIKSLEYITKFSLHMRRDPDLLTGMENILKRDVSCKECADTMSTVLKKMGNPIMTNIYYNIVKMLLERIASVMVDKESIEVLVKLIEECMQGGEVVQEVGISKEAAGERGLKLMSVLSYVFSAHFYHEKIMRHMLALLSFDYDYAAPFILKAFTYLGRYRPLYETSPDILEELVPVCKEFALTGTPKQAKHAIRCAYVNTQKPNDDSVNEIFPEIVDSFKSTLDPDNEHYRTAIVCLGHIAYNMPQKFLTQIKNIIARKIVKELLIRDVVDNRPNVPTEPWCEESELPEETYCKVEALKTMGRWLLGLKNDVTSAQKTFRMLNAFINQNGDLLEQGRLSRAEMSWLRLTAGKAMLKVCEQKGVGDQFTAEQFYNLSRLMFDPVPEVREVFAKKLHKGLSKGLPNKCLPLDFMGFYALGGRETDKRLANMVRTYVETDVNRRREYVKSFTSVDRAMTQLPHILPDYMLVFAVPILSHDPNFTNYKEIGQLRAVEKCLWLVLEPLISNKEFYFSGFYRNIIDRMKNHKDAIKSEDEPTNLKMWAICDIAIHLINQKALDLESRDFPADAVKVPAMYFKAQPDDFINSKIYIPTEIYTMVNKKPIQGSSASNTRIQPSTTNAKEPAKPIPNQNTRKRNLGHENESEVIDQNQNSTKEEVKIVNENTEPPTKRKISFDHD